MSKNDDYIGAKYYSANDLSISINLDRAKEFLDSHTELKNCSDINEVLELYNVDKLIQSGVTLTKWSSDDIENLQKRRHTIPATINTYSKTIVDSNLIELFSKVSYLYRDDFFELLERYKVYQHISQEAFKKLINEKKVYARFYLSRHRLVDYYSNVILNHMRSKPLNYAEVLLSSYLGEPRKENKLFFPQTLSSEDKKVIIEAYIEDENSNPNYLSLIARSRDENELDLSPEIRLKAKRNYEKWVENNMPKGAGITIGAEVAFGYIEDAVIVNESGEVPRYTYDKRWIETNHDYPTLLQNFIYLFNYADAQSRIQLVSYNSELGVLEKTLGVKGKNDYIIGVGFGFKAILSSLQIMAYDKILHGLDIQIEDIYSWFFSKYLSEEFGVRGFTFLAPSKDSSYREKTRDLLAELDGVLKQYDLFSKHEEIDRELLELTHNSPSFGSLHSLCDNKYGYVESNELMTIIRMLFSDQTHLAYTSITKDKYQTFAELLLKENMCLKDFESYQVEQIKWMIEQGAIVRDEDNVLKVNALRFPVYMELFHKEVICLYESWDHPFVKQLIETGQITIGNTLFTRGEQNYLDFMLNHREYSNGKDIRNRYLHGTNALTKEQQRDDYYDVLKIIALIIIKINQEFCYKYLDNKQN